ncbi:uncharacterized protein ATC70_007119 [Mucor velutinosus]|uniref:Uncharacterized protein n=1 Tax=Mucor velutinosus TaxID=708070 RepID=A0AAN7D6P0_9FUNG|nr:hypothetical protein ATC70_007119 [Mucor velutinosus]
MDNVAIFDDVLKKCNYLLELTIGVWDFGNNGWLEPAELNAWMMQNVKKCLNACELHVLFRQNPQIVEYLVYKYPSARKIVLQIHESEEKQGETIQRCIHAVNSASTAIIPYWEADKLTVLQGLLGEMKDENNRLAIRRVESRDMDCMAQVRAERCTSKRQIDFCITISRHQPASSVERIESSIGVKCHEQVWT